MEIYLIRHTKVSLPTNICYGQTDVNLADSFELEAKLIAEKLPDRNNLLCYSSPLIRCKSLAQNLFNNSFQTDVRLMELNFGAWENKSWDEIGKESFDIWHSDFINNKVPDGESYLGLSHRVNSFWQEMISVNKNMALITHGGVIRALLGNLVGLPLENSFRFQVSFGGITKISLNETLIQVEYVNR